jgi:hypothetical protein
MTTIGAISYETHPDSELADYLFRGWMPLDGEIPDCEDLPDRHGVCLREALQIADATDDGRYPRFLHNADTDHAHIEWHATAPDGAEAVLHLHLHEPLSYSTKRRIAKLFRTIQ